MRKPNIKLKQLKLEQALIQLNQYDTRIASLREKLDDLESKFNAKSDQVEVLRSEISQIEAAQSQPTQTDTPYPLGNLQ